MNKSKRHFLKTFLTLLLVQKLHIFLKAQETGPLKCTLGEIMLKISLTLQVLGKTCGQFASAAAAIQTLKKICACRGGVGGDGAAT